MSLFQFISEKEYYFKHVSRNYIVTNVKSVQSTLSHLITTSVPHAMFTHFLVEHGLSQYYLY